MVSVGPGGGVLSVLSPCPGCFLHMSSKCGGLISNKGSSHRRCLKHTGSFRGVGVLMILTLEYTVQDVPAGLSFSAFPSS